MQQAHKKLEVSSSKKTKHQRAAFESILTPTIFRFGTKEKMGFIIKTQKK